MLSRTAIITGASYGLGGALARHLASLAGVRAFSGMIPAAGYTATSGSPPTSHARENSNPQPSDP